MELPKIKIPESIHKFRGITPSDEYTQFIKDAANDIHRLYAILNENNEKLEELNDVATVENRFLYEYIEILEAIITEKDIELMGESKYALINANNITQSENNPASISKEFNQITLSDLEYTSKLYIKDEILDKNILPPSLSPIVEQVVYPDTDNVITKDNDIKYAIDGNSNTCWQRQVKILESDNTEYIEVALTIPMVNEVMSNRKINTISISPHPVMGITIVNIEAEYNNEWFQIPGFNEHSNYDILTENIHNARPIRLFFNDIMPTNIRFTLRQDTYVTEGSYRIFYIGAYSIDIGYTVSASSYGEFTTSIELLGATNELTNIINTLDNKTLSGSSYTYSIYYENELGELEFLTDTLDMNIIVPSNKLTIKGKIINNNSNIIPALHSIKVEYSTLT